MIERRGHRRTGRELCVRPASKQPLRRVRMNASLSPQTTDDIVSSAECSSDDEDLEECDSGHAGGMGVSSCACAEHGLFPLILSLICHRGGPPQSIKPHGSFKCNFGKKKNNNKNKKKHLKKKKRKGGPE